MQLKLCWATTLIVTPTRDALLGRCCSKAIACCTDSEEHLLQSATLRSRPARAEDETTRTNTIERVEADHNSNRVARRETSVIIADVEGRADFTGRRRPQWKDVPLPRIRGNSLRLLESQREVREVSLMQQSVAQGSEQ